MKKILSIIAAALLVASAAWAGPTITRGGGGGSGSGDVSTDAIWDTAGDLVYGTGANTASKLAIGTAGQVLKVNSGATAPEWTSSLSVTIDDSAAQFKDATTATKLVKINPDTVGTHTISPVGAYEFKYTLTGATDVTMPVSGTIVSSGLGSGGIILGDTTPDADGEIGYASNAYLWYANSEDFKVTASSNMWTFDSNTSAAFTFTPAVTVTGMLTANGGITGATASDPYIKLDETDGTDWWIGVDDTGNSLEFRTNVAVGNTVRMELYESTGLLVTPPAAQTIEAGNTIAANACGTIKIITSAGDVTTSTTNTFTEPAATNAGCCMDVINTGANTITLDANTNFVSAGAANVALGAGDTVRVCSTGASGKWYQIGATGNN